MRKQVQFKVSLISAAVAMMMAGSAMAAVGNELVGPDVNTSGVATVKIDQNGTGNITSSTGQTAVGNGGGAAFIVDQSAGDTTVLTIQQVGTGNTLGLSSFTNDTTSVQVFQGADAAAGNTGRLPNDDGSRSVASNSATIEIGLNADNRNEATNVFLTQQRNSNIAGLHLGKTAGVFTGTLNLSQIGATNNAAVTIDGQTTSAQTFNIGQSGPENLLALTATGNQTTGMTVNFGGVFFSQTTSTSNTLDLVGLNNASTYTYSALGGDPGLKALFLAATPQTGIKVLGTDTFNIKALGGSNNVQVDLSTAAATGNKINVNLNDAASRFAVYGMNSAAINLGGAGALNVENSKELVAYANGGTVNINDVTFNDNGYFSTANAGSITVSGGTVTTGGMSILQAGAAHSFLSTNGASSKATWNVDQTGTIISNITANNTATDTAAGSSFTLTQTTSLLDNADSMTLNNSGADAHWTATQSGDGAKTLTFTNSTPGATITASQTGASTQAATGIDFAAASLSSFTLVQR